MTLLLLGNGMPKTITPMQDNKRELIARRVRKRRDDEIVISAYSLFTEYEVKDDKRA